MIVRPDGSSHLLITQPDHAALAGRIMRHWTAGGLRESSRVREVLLAIDEHDNGWLEVDAAPIVDQASGKILDFVHAPDDVRRDVWPRGVDRLAATPYAAALVAQHALHIYERYRTKPDWASFFAGMESMRDRYLLAVPSSIDALLRDYVFVRLGDLASLIFCNGWSEALSESGYTVHLREALVVITPDPFSGHRFPIEVPAIELPDRPFNATSEVQRAMASAPRRMVTGTVCGGDPEHSTGQVRN
jgi:hypothetical protein